MSTPASAGTHNTAPDPAYAAGCAYIDGEFVPIDAARIPITDTGFTGSDCTYDVVATWRGSFFRLDRHLARFDIHGGPCAFPRRYRARPCAKY